MTAPCAPIRSALLALLFLAVPLPAQSEVGKQVLTIDDYALWRSISSTGLSEDGAWVSFAYTQRDEDDRLFVKRLDADKVHEIERGSRPVHSDDGRWVAYRVEPEKKEGEGEDDGGGGPSPGPGGRSGRGPSGPAKVELLELESGEKRSWSNGTSFAFSKGSRWFYVKKNKADRDAEHDGTDLILRDLSKGSDELLGSVDQVAFDKSGTWLAWTTDAADLDGNGLYLLDARDGSRRPLDNDALRYARLTWSEEGEALAILKGKEREGFEERENTLLCFRGFDAAEGDLERLAFDPQSAFQFPKELVLSEKASVSWSEDLEEVFFGLKEQVKAPDKQAGKGSPGGAGRGGSESEEKLADIDVWHWKDDRIQSVQMIRANRDRAFTYRGVFVLPGERFVRLTDETMREIDLTRDGDWGIGRDEREYLHDWKEDRADIYRVDTHTGERTLILEGHRRTLGLSPDSQNFLYWQDGQVWNHVLATGEATDLTANAPASFVNAEYDHPGEAPPYGVSGWTKDGEAVVLRHRYDLWLQPLDGSAPTDLTGGTGTEEEIRFRVVRTDPEERFLDRTEPWLLSAYGQWTKQSGFYSLAGGELEQLIFEDKRFGRVTKAKEADCYLFTIESFRDYPDYYVSDLSFAHPERVTDANPQQLEYRWGHRILFDFENSHGVRLQGTLAIPDGHRSGQRVPMLVNFYEKNSQNLHRYPGPRYASSPQFSGYVSAGYLVMQPDMHFNTGATHSDMLDCVERAVDKVIELGYADPERIALHGHSFSGQGSAFIATRSDKFAAVVAGAAATNLVSDFNQLWKSAGTSQHGYDIYGQGRFGTNPYDDFDLFVQESAVTHVRNMDTPLLLLHGTDDGSVEWLQAVEFYNALRFNGKEVILLSYPGEGHGLRRFENQKDFQARCRQFLDHHLKGATAPDWMTVGVPFLEKEARRKTAGS